MSSLQMGESVNTSLLKTVSDNLKKEISEHEPFNHWMFDKVLDEKTVDNLLAIPFKAPTIFDHWGKETLIIHQEYFLLLKIARQIQT